MHKKRGMNWRHVLYAASGIDGQNSKKRCCLKIKITLQQTKMIFEVTTGGLIEMI